LSFHRCKLASDLAAGYSSETFSVRGEFENFTNNAKFLVEKTNPSRDWAATQPDHKAGQAGRRPHGRFM